MNSSPASKSAIFYSLALVCIPVAFQLAAAVPAGVPDAMRLLLVLSIWASLSFALFLIGALLKAALAVWAQWPHRQRSVLCR